MRRVEDITQALWGTSIAGASNGCLVGWSVGATGTLVKLTGIPVGITNNQNQVPSTYSLSQNYPNPFNPSTKIEYSIPRAGLVDLKVFDILGREVAILVNEFKQAGNYTQVFDASKLASGVYFYSLKAGSFTETKKMLLVK